MNKIWCIGFLLGLATAMALVTGPATASEILTLEDALTRVLEKNPRLLAAEAAGSASRAREEQAHRRPNPELSFDWEDLAGGGEFSGVGSSEMTLMVSQTFELGGKRGRRREQAEGMTSLVDWERSALRQDMMFLTKEAFLEVWATQSRLDLALEQQELFAELLTEFERRVSAGAASTVELSRARGRLATAQMVGRIRSLELNSACRRLAAMWNSTEPDFSRVTADYENIQPASLTGDPALVLAENPELGQWRAQVAFQQASWNLAKSEGAIDLNLGLGVKHFAEFGDQALAISAGLPLPVFDSNKDEARAAEYELDQVRLQGTALKTTLMTEVAVYRQEAQTALDEVHTLQDEIIPQATKAFEATRDGHAQGFFTLTDVLETRQFLNELRETHIDGLVRHYMARARLRRLAGEPAPGIFAAEERTSP
jgi:cobalt-zinc-cadmium efflux system outer membrane protein